MEKLFHVIDTDSLERIGNLMAEAHSQVKSTKYFPIYNVGGKRMIFKPLSKTKPLTTPLFAYSEVYWSYVIQTYFEPKTPRYFLASSKTIEQEQPKYYPQGVLVESITEEGESLQNLFDYFTKFPDPLVDIKDYINYCMMQYDYTPILLSKLFLMNTSLGENLAYQVLLSILRQDQNFHYENINFLWREGIPTLAPPIDFEFSTPFLYPDNLNKKRQEQYKYALQLVLPRNEEEKQLYTLLSRTQTKNICLIVKLYPQTVEKFIKSLETFDKESHNIILQDTDHFLGPCNSDSWLIGDALLKEKDIPLAQTLQEKIIPITLDKQVLWQQISNDIATFNKTLLEILKFYLTCSQYDIPLEDATLSQLFDSIEKKPTPNAKKLEKQLKKDYFS